MKHNFFYILFLFSSLVLQGQAFTHPVPVPDTSCLQEEEVLATVTFSNSVNSKYAIDMSPNYNVAYNNS